MDDLDTSADPAAAPAPSEPAKAEPPHPGGVPATAGTPDDRTAASSETGTPAADPGKKPVEKKRRSFIRELPFLIGVAVVLALLLRVFLVQTFYIPSSSMEDTLRIDDRVLVNKAVYKVRDIKRGEVIVFSGADSFDFAEPDAQADDAVAKALAGAVDFFGGGGERDYIKRVIGLPGDRVACCDSEGRLTVNGVALNESDYLFPGDRPSLSTFEIVVPEGRLWVMGDHRSVSQDSRSHLGEPGGGTVPVDHVVGKAFVVIWPIGHWRSLEIPDTFKQPEIDANAGR